MMNTFDHSALFRAQASLNSTPTPAAHSNKDIIGEKAKELEGVFLNTLVSQMFESLETRGEFGGGYAEETWRSMQAEQYATMIAENGGIGLADQIMANLLSAQEAADASSRFSPPLQGAYQP